MSSSAPTAPTSSSSSSVPSAIGLRRALSTSTTYSTGEGSSHGQDTTTTSAKSSGSEPPRKRPRIGMAAQLEMQRSQSMQSASMDAQEDQPVYDPMLDGEPERDEQFYYPEADCVVRVGGTLFRVHKFLLARDASAFQDMFSIPSDADADSGPSREGRSDANPIVLYGETEDEFRILLSALYALPSDLQKYATSHADISRLITICYLTNKYHFASTSQWAISSLYHVLVQYSSPSISSSSGSSPLTSPTSPSHASPPFGWDIERLSEEYDLNTCSPELLVRIMDVAMICGHDELSALVENRWIDRLWNGPPSSASSSSSSSSISTGLQDPDRKASGHIHTRADEAKWAVSVADRWEMKRLRGVAYYVCLMEMGDELSRVAQGRVNSYESEGSERHDALSFTEDPASASVTHGSASHMIGMGGPPPLTPSQTTRLLLGHLSLTHLWDSHLHIHAPSIPSPSPGSCTYHQHGCIYTWVSAWRDAARSPVTLKHKSNDVVGRVRSMEKQLVGNDGLIVALTPGCRRKALGAVREMVKGMEEGLGDHFRGAIVGEL